MLLRYAFIAILFLGFSAHAQELTPGKYSGHFVITLNTGDRNVPLELDIESVEGGIVKGVATNHSPQCFGKYPVAGKISGNQIGMRAMKKGGPSGDCDFAFRGTFDGNKISGNLGKYPFELRK